MAFIILGKCFTLLSVSFSFLSITICSLYAYGLTHKYVLRIIESFYDLVYMYYRRLLYAGQSRLWMNNWFGYLDHCHSVGNDHGILYKIFC